MNATVKELRGILANAGIEVSNKAKRAELLAMVAELPGNDTLTESPIVTAIESAESALRDGIASKARVALVRDESKRHTLYMGSTASRDTDVFAAFRLFTIEESFAVLDTDDSRFVRLADMSLETHALYVQVSITGYSRVINTLRGSSERVTRIAGATFLLPVKLAYNAESDRFKIESVLPVVMSYSKAKGFAGMDDSAINRRIPGMDSDSLRHAVIRKLTAFIANSAESVNDLQIERNGKPTLYGEWKAARDSAKAGK